MISLEQKWWRDQDGHLNTLEYVVTRFRNIITAFVVAKLVATTFSSSRMVQGSNQTVKLVTHPAPIDELLTAYSASGLDLAPVPSALDWLPSIRGCRRIYLVSAAREATLGIGHRNLYGYLSGS